MINMTNGKPGGTEIEKVSFDGLEREPARGDGDGAGDPDFPARGFAVDDCFKLAFLRENLAPNEEVQSQALIVPIQIGRRLCTNVI